MKWYEVLGVNGNASKEEIRNRYKTLAKKYHPDMLIGKSQKIIEISEEAMKKINVAYSEGLKLNEVSPSESEQVKARKAAEERIKRFVKEEAEKRRQQQEEYNNILKKTEEQNKIYIYREIIKNYYPNITDAQILYIFELNKQKKSDYKIFLKNLKRAYPKLTDRQIELMILLLDNVEKYCESYNYDYQKATGKKVL